MISLFVLILTILILYIIYLLSQKTKKSSNQPESASINNQITHDRLKEMEEQLDGLPNKVLESINGSISNHKGKLAELIAYVNLKAKYDKVIPLGNIVDFLGIRFPTETDPGTFDFIDIKNGKSARLSQDQKQLQKLIQEQRIQF